MLNNRIDSVVRQVSFGELDGILDRVRKAIRLADYPQAELLLRDAQRRKDRETAEYLNLQGVLHEGQRKWRQAAKCYRKALETMESYEPARSNLQRLIRLRHGGETSWAIQLGDEIKGVWFAQLPAGL